MIALNSKPQVCENAEEKHPWQNGDVQNKGSVDFKSCMTKYTLLSHNKHWLSLASSKLSHEDWIALSLFAYSIQTQ